MAMIIWAFPEFSQKRSSRRNFNWRIGDKAFSGSSNRYMHRSDVPNRLEKTSMNDSPWLRWPSFPPGAAGLPSSSMYRATSANVSARKKKPLDTFGSHDGRITNELAQALSPEGYSTPEGISVREMEIALDVSADDPHSLVQSLAPTVHRSFSRTLENHYGSSAQGYVERDREQLLVYGFAGPDERVKLYEKTNRRVRLECVFGVKAFKRHGISRSMRHDEGLELGSIIEDVARVAFPHIDLIHSSSRNIPPPPGEPPEVFFANVCKRTRTPERAVDLCRNLIRHGRIRGGFDRGFISRLVADGILRRLQHGVYVVTQTYERAVERLRLLDEEWQSFLWRAAA